MGSAPPINFVVSAPSRRPELVSVAARDARFLVAALRGFGPDDEMPNARSIANLIQAALHHKGEREIAIPPEQERELLVALDRIAIESRRPLPGDLPRLRNALADAADHNGES
jgi:hypothetical protein